MNTLVIPNESSQKAICKEDKEKKNVCDLEAFFMLNKNVQKPDIRALLLWDPGIAQRQPFIRVASSKASHSPVHVVGSV